MKQTGYYPTCKDGSNHIRVIFDPVAKKFSVEVFDGRSHVEVWGATWADGADTGFWYGSPGEVSASVVDDPAGERTS